MNSKLDLSFILNNKGVGAMPQVSPNTSLLQQNLPTQNLYYQQNSEPSQSYPSHGAYKRPREETREDIDYISGLQPPIVRQRVLTQGYPSFSVGSNAVIPTATSSIPQNMYAQQPQLQLSLNTQYETSNPSQYSSQYGLLPPQQQVPQVLPQVSLNSIQQHPQQEQILNMLINYKKPEMPQIPQERRPEEEFEVFIPPALPPLSSLLKPVDVTAQTSHAQLSQHQTQVQQLPQRPIQQLPAVQPQQQYDLQYKPAVTPQYQFPSTHLPPQQMSQHPQMSQLPQLSHIPQQHSQQNMAPQPQYIQQYTPRTPIQPPQPQMVYPQMEQGSYYAPPPQPQPLPQPQPQQMTHNPNMYSAPMQHPPPSSYNMVQHSHYQAPAPQYQPIPQQQQQQIYAPPPQQQVIPQQAMPPQPQVKYQSPTESNSDGGSPAAGSSSASPNAEQKLQEHHQLQPIRILAHQIGLSKDPNKSWRYRDIKRSLFEKMTPEQEKFIDLNSEHAIIKERLPHKLSMCSFAKRIFLLVFHFIIRDGREPKFWRRQNVNHELVEEVLTKYESTFYTRVNKDIAFACYQLLHANDSEGGEASDQTDKKKLSMDQAMQIATAQHLEKLHQHHPPTQQQPSYAQQAQSHLHPGAVPMPPQQRGSLPAVKLQPGMIYQ